MWPPSKLKNSFLEFLKCGAFLSPERSFQTPSAAFFLPIRPPEKGTGRIWPTFLRCPRLTVALMRRGRNLCCVTEPFARRELTSTPEQEGQKPDRSLSFPFRWHARYQGNFVIRCLLCPYPWA